jgi:hypothetical protein
MPADASRHKPFANASRPKGAATEYLVRMTNAEMATHYSTDVRRIVRVLFEIDRSNPPAEQQAVISSRIAARYRWHEDGKGACLQRTTFS